MDSDCVVWNLLAQPRRVSNEINLGVSSLIVKSSSYGWEISFAFSLIFKNSNATSWNPLAVIQPFELWLWLRQLTLNRVSSIVSYLAAIMSSLSLYRSFLRVWVPSALTRVVFPQNHPSMAKLHFFMNHGLASQLLESQG